MVLTQKTRKTPKGLFSKQLQSQLPRHVIKQIGTYLAFVGGCPAIFSDFKPAPPQRSPDLLNLRVVFLVNFPLFWFLDAYLCRCFAWTIPHFQEIRKMIWKFVIILFLQQPTPPINFQVAIHFRRCRAFASSLFNSLVKKTVSIISSSNFMVSKTKLPAQLL